MKQHNATDVIRRYGNHLGRALNPAVRLGVWVACGVLLVVCASVLSTSALQAASQTFKIVVTGGEDNNVRDDSITLREALLISEGKLLQKDLTSAEAKNVEISPSLLERHLISLAVPKIALNPKKEGPLPDILANGTRIASVVGVGDTNFTLIDGNGLDVCLNAKAFRFELKGVESVNCGKLVQEDTSKATPDDEITVIIGPARIRNGKDGIEFIGPKSNRAGNGKQVVQLLDLEMKNLSGLPLSLSASEGVVEVRRSRFETQGEVQIKADFGDGTGDLNFEFDDNMLFLKDGRRGFFLKEHQQSGKLNYHFKGNFWQGGKVQFDAEIGAEGTKVSELNTYVDAKVAVQQKIEAFSSGTITLQASSETYLRNKTGNHTEIVSGFVEYSDKFYNFDNNDLALDWFVRAKAHVTWHSSQATTTGSVDLGWRIFGDRGVSFELFISKSLWGRNHLGGHFRELGDSISIEDSSITESKTDGFLIEHTHATIANSQFKDNGGSGLVLKDSSHAEIKSSQFVKNGQHGIDSQDSQLEILSSTIDQNKKNGLDLIQSSSAITTSDMSSNDGNGLENTNSQVEVQNSTILFNKKNGIAIDESPAVIETSLICFNKQDGINITGDSHVNAMTDIIDANGAYEVGNQSPNYVNATNNNWGPITADEMDHKPYPSNISVIYDVFDNPSKGFVEYAGWGREGCTVTSTPTPTSTPTDTPTDTPTASSTPVITQTRTPTATRTPTITITVTRTPTRIGTNTPTRTVASSPTKTLAPTRIPTITPTFVSPTRTPTGTATRTSSPTATSTPTATNTATRTPSMTSPPTSTASPPTVAPSPGTGTPFS